MHFALITFILLAAPKGGDSEKAESFRRITWDASQWRDFMYQASDFSVKTILECGSLCQLRKCQVFLHLQDAEKCYIGHTGNTKAFPTSELVGDYPIYITKSGIVQALGSNYVVIGDVENSAVWQRFVYKVLPLQGAGDMVDCSAACSGSEAANGCAFFVYQDAQCYFGSMAHVNGTLSLTNSTLYVVPSYLSAWSVYFLELPNTYNREWTRHIQLVLTDVTFDFCRCFAKVNSWQYFVYATKKQLCYLGYLQAREQNTSAVIVAETAIQSVWVNVEMASIILDENYRMREVNFISPNYVYGSEVEAATLSDCAVVCTFYNDDQCDFFYLIATTCYFGSFNHDALSVVVDNPGNIVVYINQFDVSPVVMSMYLSQTVSKSDYTCHAVEILTDSTTLQECAAVAAIHANRDFFSFDEANSICYLGDASYKRDCSAPDTNDTIYIHQVNAMARYPGYYDQAYVMDPSDGIWTRWSIYEVNNKADSRFTCSYLCAIAAKCRFYAFNDGSCYLGRYDSTGTEAFANSMTFYHRWGLANAEGYPGEFWPFCCLYYVNQWVYKNDGVATSSDLQCRSGCLFDSNCHFAYISNADCWYGNYNYAGPPASNANSTGKQIWFRFGYDNLYDATVNFNSYTGLSAQPNGLVSSIYWKKYSFYWYRRLGEPESSCAKICFLVRLVDCHFYLFNAADGACLLGRFSGSYTSSYGGAITDNLTIKVRKDYDIATEAAKEATADKDCLNSGYKQLNAVNAGFAFDTGTLKAGTTCLWQVYAPGAANITVTLTSIDVTH